MYRANNFYYPAYKSLIAKPKKFPPAPSFISDSLLVPPPRGGNRNPRKNAYLMAEHTTLNVKRTFKSNL